MKISIQRSSYFYRARRHPIRCPSIDLMTKPQFAVTCLLYCVGIAGVYTLMAWIAGMTMGVRVGW